MSAHENVESLRVGMLHSLEFRRVALYSPWLLPLDECPRIDVETETGGEEGLRRCLSVWRSPGMRSARASRTGQS